MNYNVSLLTLLFISISFLGTIATDILLLRTDDANNLSYAQGTGYSNSSVNPTCLGGTPIYTNMTPASGSGLTISKGVNSTSSLDNLVPVKKVNSTMNSTDANVSVGRGELIGTSKAVKPESNLIPQDKEPVILVPNLTAYQEAKNQVNSACPPKELISRLENKNVLEPPTVPSEK